MKPRTSTLPYSILAILKQCHGHLILSHAHVFCIKQVPLSIFTVHGQLHGHLRRNKRKWQKDAKSKHLKQHQFQNHGPQLDHKRILMSKTEKAARQTTGKKVAQENSHHPQVVSPKKSVLKRKHCETSIAKQALRLD